MMIERNEAAEYGEKKGAGSALFHNHEKRGTIMSDTIREFLEFMSKQSEEVRAKAAAMSMEELTAFAKENGFELAVKEFDEGEVDVSEAEAVAGGYDFVPPNPYTNPNHHNCNYYSSMGGCTSVGCYCPSTGSGNYDPWYDEKHKNDPSRPF